ncbi:hypothetical protein O6H91_Y294400 [Diphasiastrum complanatum]|nr:hypothetical protein O6H91_Y294400 [Diphasiastrum complanatum]
MQCDSSTYCNEPEDKEDYSLWLSTFDLNSRKSEMDVILNDNTFIQELKERIVPAIVDEKTFWTRYFYRLNKLQQTEDTRADIVKRATAGEEEELTWEVDDESDEVKPSVIPPFLETTKGSNSPSDALVEDIHNEDEAKSDNSTGSEWLVVQEDKDSLNLEVSQVKDAIASERLTVNSNNNEALVPTESKENSHCSEPELEEIGELNIEDDLDKPQMGQQESSQKIKSKSHREDAEEDWGEWE